jgi:Ca-activated chloride channel family protein
VIFQPVLNPLLILLLCAPVAALANWVLVRPPQTDG